MHVGQCTNFVGIGPAARAAGVPYQYIYGIAKRNFGSNKPRISVRSKPVYGKVAPKLEVCLDCIIDKYGKAGANQTQLLATPLIGYRGWDISNNTLVSWHKSEFPWLPSKTEATCDKGHEVPGRRCGCGLYALEEANPGGGYGAVFGQVKLWGRFRGSDQGERHIRAQYGRPTALLCTRWRGADVVHRVAELYRIPVTHSLKSLQATDWSLLAQLEGDNDEDGTGEQGGRSPTGRSGSPAGGASERAACREAAAGASTLQELKHLARDGIISFSNVEEIFTF